MFCSCYISKIKTIFESTPALLPHSSAIRSQPRQTITHTYLSSILPFGLCMYFLPLSKNMHAMWFRHGLSATLIITRGMKNGWILTPVRGLLLLSPKVKLDPNDKQRRKWVYIVIKVKYLIHPIMQNNTFYHRIISMKSKMGSQKVSGVTVLLKSLSKN